MPQARCAVRNRNSNAIPAEVAARITIISNVVFIRSEKLRSMEPFLASWRGLPLGEILLRKSATVRNSFVLSFAMRVGFRRTSMGTTDVMYHSETSQLKLARVYLGGRWAELNADASLPARKSSDYV